MITTLFDSYRQGLAALIAALGPGHPQLDLAYVYQQRLTENLARTAYGDTESLQAARAEILDRCHCLSLDTTGQPFVAFCPPVATLEPAAPTAPAGKYTINISGGQVGAIGDNVQVTGGIHFGGKDKA